MNERSWLHTGLRYTEENAEATMPTEASELERLRKRNEELEKALPVTFYADRSIEFRISEIVSQWRRAVTENQFFEAFVKALELHWLAGIDCDHVNKTDKAQCACSLVSLPACSSVGEAVDSWIEHVKVEAARLLQKGSAE